jgi:heat shock protein HtpX
MAFAFVVALVMNLGAYWFSGDIALRMAGAREVSPAEAPGLTA